MLRIDNLRVNYGGIEAVKDISFTVPEGKIVAKNLRGEGVAAKLAEVLGE